MYAIAEQVQRWLAADKTVRVAQVVASRGFSSSDASAALAWTDDGEFAGALFPRMDADLPVFEDRLDGRLVELAVSDAEAVAGGLSCGGVATVFVQNAAAYPAGFWAQVERREPLCLLHEIVADNPGVTEVYTRGAVRDAVHRPGGADAARSFARGTSAASLAVEGNTSLAIVTLWPPTQLVVIGNGTIADALSDVGALLGWTTIVINDGAGAAQLAATLTESDAAVVLSHDRDVDVPALAAILAGRAGYVGALGSRHTQAARRDGLAGLGVDTEQIGRIHGPAGLDVDAHTPGEIAVSIVAEILAIRSGSSGGPISGRQGPVHIGGATPRR